MTSFGATYKIVTIGQSNTGKSSIISSFMGLGLTNEVTILSNIRALPVTFTKKDVEKRVKLQLLDTCGQERHQATLPGMLYRNAHAAIVVYDLSDPSSLQGLDRRIEAFLEYARQEAVLFLVGNKSDLVQGESALAD